MLVCDYHDHREESDIMLEINETNTEYVQQTQFRFYGSIRSLFLSGVFNITLIGLLFISATAKAYAESRTLSNLERERSSLVSVMTQEELSPIDRERRIALSQRRLMDMERMVIRDDRLLGSHDPMVKKAFDHYETTFLVHASAEANQHIVDFWLHQLSLDSQSILESRRGRR